MVPVELELDLVGAEMVLVALELDLEELRWF